MLEVYFYHDGVYVWDEYTNMLVYSSQVYVEVTASLFMNNDFTAVQNPRDLKLMSPIPTKEKHLKKPLNNKCTRTKVSFLHN